MTRPYSVSMNEDQSEQAKTIRNKAFGKRLKSIRKHKEVTQEQLAEQTGRTSETISKIERGLVYPGVDLLIQIADYLDVSLDTLLGRGVNASMTDTKQALTTEALVLLERMDEKTLTVAINQLKALVKLS